MEREHSRLNTKDMLHKMESRVLTFGENRRWISIVYHRLRVNKGTKLLHLMLYTTYVDNML